MINWMIPLKRLILSLFFFSLGWGAFAQTPALVRFSDLKFNSEFEKDAFTILENDTPDYLRLFLAVSPSSDEDLFRLVNQKILSVTDYLNDKKFEKLKDEKKVVKIYEKVNGDILNRYEEKVLFPVIFSSGNFNCLTASAYYGFIFSNLGIDFEFKETSSHVHPVAFPKSLQIKVETTDPINGFQYFDTKLKVQFVNYLVDSKIISKEDAGSSSLDDIFNKYYFPESTIGLRELAGLQYLNDAFYSYGQEKYVYAFKQSQKAYYLYPSDRNSTVMLFLLSSCIEGVDYKNVEDVSFLAFASRFVGKELKKELFIEEFKSLTQKVLLDRSQTTLYEQMFAYLKSTIDTGEVLNAIEIEYYFQMGRVLMISFRIKEGLSYFEKALAIEPDNLELQTYTVQSLAFSFTAVSNQEIVKSTEEFEIRFPQMRNNEGFIGLQMIGYLQLGEEKFDFEKPDEGEILLKKFENLYNLHPGISIQYEKVGDAYSAAAVYYFKRNNINTARSYLNRGLVISPENYQLMYRLRALNE
jgi:tetratricopeptide (TPR) repeat protein